MHVPRVRVCNHIPGLPQVPECVSHRHLPLLPLASVAKLVSRSCRRYVSQPSHSLQSQIMRPEVHATLRLSFCSTMTTAGCLLAVMGLLGVSEQGSNP